MDYPSLLRRISATLLDFAVIVLVLGNIVWGLLPSEIISAKVFSGIMFAVLYEPVLTSYGCTLGQAVMQTRVRHFETLQRVELRKSFLRFFVKYVVSVVGAARNDPRDDGRANHDLAADTVVVNASAA